MKLRTLGKTGLKVSVLGFGCWAIGGTGYGPTNDEDSRRALAFAHDQGINFFDTSDVYGNGHSEQLLGEMFQPSSKRLNVIIATKVGWDFYHGEIKRNLSPDYIRFACEQSLKRLRTDYLDVYQLHNPRLEHLEDRSVFDCLEALKKEGKIRHYGVSIFQMDEAKAAMEGTASESVQLVLNLIDQRPIEDILPLAAKTSTGIIAREPLACGLLTGKYGADSVFHKMDHRGGWSSEKLARDLEKIERICRAFNIKRILLKQAALEFVLSFPAVSTVIPGMKTVQHVQDHLRAVENPELFPKEIADLQSLYKQEAIFQTGFW